ncbi:MAG: hypothetical protein HY898_08535 [Deltaproteobacteria bacterium]|nr:hypothetical protein [Deltaproteobacteria bacterium]
MTSRRDRSFKLKTARVSSPLRASGLGSHTGKAAKWYVRALADDLFRLRARFDLMATGGVIPRTT